MCLDTTLHRDHVSGAARLAAKTGSPYYVPSDERFQGESHPLEEQSTLPLGDTPIDVIVLPNINRQMDLSVGLFYGDRFFLSGDHPIRHEAFRRSVEAIPACAKPQRKRSFFPPTPRISPLSMNTEL